MVFNFDMDGTFVNFYAVNGWLEMLNAESVKPYEIAEPLFNMNVFAKMLNKLIANGHEVNIISWASKNASDEYINQIATAKKNWLKKHLKSVQFNTISIVPYGSPKSLYGNGILFDDELKNREEWHGVAYDVDNILTVLKNFS